MQTKNPSTVLTGDGDSLVSLGNLFQVLNVIILSITFFFSPKVKPKSISCYLLLTPSPVETQSIPLLFAATFRILHKCDYVSSCRFSSSPFCRLNRPYFLDFWLFLLFSVLLLIELFK